MKDSAMQQAIAGWNGKSADDIAAVYRQFSDDPSFVADIVRLSAQAHYQKGATWLLKAHIDAGHSLQAKDISRIYRALKRLVDWESKLHVLQCMAGMPIASSDRKHVELFLRQCLPDTNKFVRAWTYNGFYELARQYPQYQKEAEQFFAMAMRDEAASVKARVRAILKKGFKNTK